MLPNVFPPIDPHVRIGHVHLKVADPQRSLDFYCGVLGFQLMQRYGEEAAFISAGSYHHHIGLNTWESAGAKPPPPNATGLYHVAILYPGRVQLADALSRLKRANIPLDGASDHGVSEALYLRDPDSNGIELCWDRPRELWPSSPTGAVQMFTRPLDLRDLLAELGQNRPWGGRHHKAQARNVSPVLKPGDPIALREADFSMRAKASPMLWWGRRSKSFRPAGCCARFILDKDACL